MFAHAADLKIDHVTVAGRDLKSMQARLESVGMRCEYGGAHSNGATEMALTSFPDGSYLELIALQPNAGPAAVARQPWAKAMEGDAGPCAWAVRVKDIAAEVKRLQSAGITVEKPERSGRTRPDGTKLEWETAQIGAEPRGTFFPFLIQDFTRRQARAFPTGKPTTKDFGGVSRVVIAVNDLKEAIKRYRAAYSLAPAIQQVDERFGAQLALLGGTPVVLAAPLTSDSWIAKRVQKLGPGPCAFILTGRKTSHYKVTVKSRWFGTDISWLDVDKLGWPLGFE
jgi:catechol 2,3-dioxygenase-like lactoylglutathione lyase family enzyme